LPGISGLDLLRRLRADRIRIPLILLADESDVPTAVTAMQAGASDFIEKPHADIAILRRVVQLLQQTSRRADD
jgi:two-component system response regulator FixJ